MAIWVRSEHCKSERLVDNEFFQWFCWYERFHDFPFNSSEFSKEDKN